MSYDIEYVDPVTEKAYGTSPFWEGGTHRMDGNRETSLNITYNYSRFYYEHLDKNEGIRWLYGKKGSEVSDALFRAVYKLGIKRHEGPWYTINNDLILGALTGKKMSKDQEEWMQKNKGFFSDPNTCITDPEGIEDKDTREMVKEGISLGALTDGGGYWCPTPGNAGYALNILLQWSLLFPEGVFRGD